MIREVLPMLEIRWWRVGRAVLLGGLALGCSVVLAALSAWLIARASQMPPVLTLSMAVVGVRAAGLGRGIFRYLERLASHDVALRGMAALRANYYEVLAKAPLNATTAFRRGDSLARVGADVDEVGNLLVRSLVPTGVAVLVGLGSVLYLTTLLPPAGLALLACLAVTGVVTPWLVARRARLTETAAAAARAEVAARTLALLEDGDQLRVAGRWDQELGSLAAAERRLEGTAQQTAITNGGAAALRVFAMAASVIVMLWISHNAVDISLSRVNVAVLVLTPMAVFEATSTLPNAAIQFYKSNRAAHRLAEAAGIGNPPLRGDQPSDIKDDLVITTAPVMTAESVITTESPNGGNTSAPVLTAKSLVVGWDRDLFPKLDLALTPGVITTIQAPSGAGKTTLLMTLAGLITPRHGSVQVTAATPPVFIAEDGHIFGTTVLENLRVARGDVTAAEAERILAIVGLSDWLAGLPQGVQTILAPGATSISGGERRKLLIARALASNSQILLLDEPFEHLDKISAQNSYNALLTHARESKSNIVIATHIQPKI